MTNARVLFQNLADPGIVTASSWIASAPPSRLQNMHVRRRWKGREGDTESITFDLLSAQTGDLVSLFGCARVMSGTQSNMTEAAIRRVRLSLTDPTAVLGEVYDSGSTAGKIKSAYGAMVERLPAPVSFRYGLIDLSESGAEALLAGRLVVGLLNPFTINFAYNWSFGFGDLSRKKKSAGGQTYIDRDDRYRILNLTFETLDEADRYGFVHEMDRINGASSDILFMIDPDSADLTRDTIWGLPPELSLPSQPNLAFFSKLLNIEERL